MPQGADPGVATEDRRTAQARALTYGTEIGVALGLCWTVLGAPTGKRLAPVLGELYRCCAASTSCRSATTPREAVMFSVHVGAGDGLFSRSSVSRTGSSQCGQRQVPYARGCSASPWSRRARRGWRLPRSARSPIPRRDGLGHCLALAHRESHHRVYRPVQPRHGRRVAPALTDKSTTTPTRASLMR